MSSSVGRRGLNDFHAEHARWVTVSSCKLLRRLTVVAVVDVLVKGLDIETVIELEFLEPLPIDFRNVIGTRANSVQVVTGLV